MGKLQGVLQFGSLDACLTQNRRYGTGRNHTGAYFDDDGALATIAYCPQLKVAPSLGDCLKSQSCQGPNDLPTAIPPQR